MNILFCGDIMPGGVLAYQKEYISEEKLENLMNLNRPMIQPREIVDYDSKENSEFSEKKGNLDTYNTPTVKPNIINKKKPNQPANNNLNNESNNPSENNNANNKRESVLICTPKVRHFWRCIFL